MIQSMDVKFEGIVPIKYLVLTHCKIIGGVYDDSDTKQKPFQTSTVAWENVEGRPEFPPAVDEGSDDQFEW